jgi:hypothetical protein
LSFCSKPFTENKRNENEIDLKTVTDLFFYRYLFYNICRRILHSGSALAFQARGAGSIPAIRSSQKTSFFEKKKRNQVFYFLHNGGYSQVVKAVDCDSTIRRFKSGYSPFTV